MLERMKSICADAEPYTTDSPSMHIFSLPRRYGKTTLVLETLFDILQSSDRTVIVYTESLQTCRLFYDRLVQLITDRALSNNLLERVQIAVPMNHGDTTLYRHVFVGIQIEATASIILCDDIVPASVHVADAQRVLLIHSPARSTLHTDSDPEIALSKTFTNRSFHAVPTSEWIY